MQSQLLISRRFATVELLSGVPCSIMPPDKAADTAILSTLEFNFVERPPRHGESAALDVLVSRKNPSENVIFVVLHGVPVLVIALKAKLQGPFLQTKLKTQRLELIIESADV
jgi:hypothetical protein